MTVVSGSRFDTEGSKSDTAGCTSVLVFLAVAAEPDIPPAKHVLSNVEGALRRKVREIFWVWFAAPQPQ